MVSEPTDFVHRWLPAGHADARTLLLLHGTGGDESDLLPLGRMLDPSAALLGIRGRILEQGMPRFFRRLAEGVFDLEDLRVRANELADWIERAPARFGFDPARLTAVGFSNGANIAAAVLLLRPGTLSRAALLSPMVPLEPDPLPDLAHARVFIGAGRADPIAPPDQARRLGELLRTAGAAVALHWTPGGHGLDPGELAAARAWLTAGDRAAES
jgi:phospholipase/carboxylesterase/glyoxalase family protein